jgi:putative membrane protein
MAGVGLFGSLPAVAQSPAGPQSGGAPMSQQGQAGSPSPDMNGPMAAGQSDIPPVKMDDKKFVKDAAMGGMIEVELGKLAQQKASSDAVKQFGQKMVDDHSKANDELKQVASKQNFTVPDSLDSKHQSRITKLGKLSGTDFDRAYIKDQLKDHEEDVKKFGLEAQSGSNNDVKSFAAKTLPTLQQHLQQIKTLSKSDSSMSMK